MESDAARSKYPTTGSGASRGCAPRDVATRIAMDMITPDRILSHMERLPPLPAAVGRFLDGGDVSTAEALEGLREVLAPDGVGLGEQPWWNHALAVAEGAAVVARSTARCDARAAYMAGLLHDVGQLVALQLAPAAFHRALVADAAGTPFLAREREICGLDHQRAGEQLLRRWGVPTDICRVAREHHDAEGNQMAPLIAVVTLADAWAQWLGHGFDFPPGGLSLRVEEAASAVGLIWGEQLDLLSKVDFGNVVAERDGEPRLADADPARALWVSVHGGEPSPLGRLLLQHRGYDVVHVAATAALEPQDGELILIDSPWAEPDEVGELVSELVPAGGSHVALLADAKGGAPVRRRDPASGVCGIPRLFTAFDVRWLQSCPVITP